MTTNPVGNLAGVSVAFARGRDVVSGECQLDRAISEMCAVKTPCREAVRTFQRCLVVDALIVNSRHLGRTAQELRMHRNTLTRATRELAIDVRQIRRSIQTRQDERVE